jgi:hypothetical protein
VSAKLIDEIPPLYKNTADFEAGFSAPDQRRARSWETREQPPVGIPGLSCTTNLFFGFFFDRTKNNYLQVAAGKNHSNVARLYDSYPGLSVKRVLPESTEWANIDDEWSN